MTLENFVSDYLQIYGDYPTINTDLGVAVNGNCFELGQKVKPRSVELIFTDPPYGEAVSSKWDKMLPSEDLWEIWDRALTETGHVVVTTNFTLGAHLVVNAPRDYKIYDMVWLKDRVGNIFHAKWRPLVVHENILVFQKITKGATYNPQLRPPITDRTTTTVNRSNYDGYDLQKRPAKILVTKPTGRNPISVVEFKVERGGRIHPTQKPLELCNWVIKTWSNPNQAVLDTTFGSGVILQSAQLNKRHWLGFELDGTFFSGVTKLLREVPTGGLNDL